MATTNVPPVRQPQPQPTPAPCCCPSCLGIQCLERPRYFAGQLLTEGDFNSEQDYMLAKNRLHNRYLHGPGVVCGLEVVCSNCDGWVTVQPGYAIDPCGNDILICDPASFNVIEAINQCCDGRRQRRKSGCDPYQPPQNDACGQTEQHWCITIEYQEKESRGTMPLRNQASCSCGATAGSCGCGGHAKTKQNGKNGNCSCSPPKTKPQQPKQCEPTRIREGYKLCVIEEPPGCEPTERVVAAGPLLTKIRECATTLATFYAKLPAQARAIAQAVITGGVPNATPPEVADACCRIRRALIDLITSSDYNVHCDLLASIPPCTSDPNGLPANIAAIKAMNLILEQLLLDCICRAILPPCGGDPCDDRLILACVTVRNGKVIRICNFSCRKYAGSFPALYYWLSIFPIFSQIAARIRQICCEFNIADRIDPAGSLRNAARASNYAAPQMLSANIDAILSRFSLESIGNLAGPGSVSLPSLIGQPASQAARLLEQSKVSVVDRQVGSASDVPASKTLTGNLFANSGDTVVLYRAGDIVAGFAPYDSVQELADTRAELDTLKAAVAALQQRS